MQTKYLRLIASVNGKLQPRITKVSQKNETDASSHQEALARYVSTPAKVMKKSYVMKSRKVLLAILAEIKYLAI